MCNVLFFGFIESYDCYVLMLFFDFFIVSFVYFQIFWEWLILKFGMFFFEGIMEYLMGLCQDFYNVMCFDIQICYFIWVFYVFKYNMSGGLFFFDIWWFLEVYMYFWWDSFVVVILVIIIYGILFVIGIFGNICMCFVIVWNKFMYIVMNYYLFNLVVVDFFLLVIGFLLDLYFVWLLYFWVFGEMFCVMCVFVCEIFINIFILMIMVFIVE